jgi:cadmium resistance protein CadD (predicted permease)
MHDLVGSSLVAAIVFATTDVDDLVLLVAFFASPTLRARSVVAGQLLGIAVLVCVSAAAAFATRAVSPGYVALLGVVPLALGVAQLFRLFIRGVDAAEESNDVESNVAARTRSQVLAVAAITVANGGDNLGVYIPLFARDPSLVAFYAAVFGVMTLLWCFMAYRLVRHPVLGERIRRYGHLALPLVLIALGLWILWGARVLLG